MRSIVVWSIINQQIETANVIDNIATNPIPMFKYMIDIINNKSANVNLKKNIAAFITFCKKDRLLSLKVIWSSVLTASLMKLN